MATKFVPRLTRPEKGNKYYITKSNGGYSSAIVGSPTDKDCNVLSNCVGYAYGRFNEIAGCGSCKYLYPVNAKDFIKYKGDCVVGQTPKLGACMVWDNGKAGHVAIVEQINSDNEIITSESAWGGPTFYTVKRIKGSDGNWGYGGNFLGFIYNPKEFEQESDNMYILNNDVPGYNKASDAAAGINPNKELVKAGEYHMYYKYPKGFNGMFNITKNPASAGSWINPKDNKPKVQPNEVDTLKAEISSLEQEIKDLNEKIAKVIAILK